ncbi:lipoyl(octanoyl) transferase [Chishuiella changwenlii]|jgi:lipoyl(octanoyl) transferase|uniref:Octanoyltransferase n=1 Tax=Chishuiella changwenlii TaxID=1434701 RepID=A0A1M6YG31_9FLAO|nr:lipoyl(octanoyl) transferase LipB [Chishuiella changwenlii]GGE97398.1 octanoyltransferase [Chishuiella changwenlii]SHL17050.1 lipoyl(octanoyl) transferase [Chishuiella changwenlii]
MKQVVEFQDLGINKDYQEAWDFQESLLAENIATKQYNRAQEKEGSSDFKSTKNHLLFVEHPHIYTLGKSGHLENMLASSDKLSEINATFVKTNRGGDITYHGPGQLVGYPILDLDNFKPDIHLYMRNLEEVIIKTIAEYGLKGERSKGETGVWLDVGKPYARKICAMGVKASRWITMHGFALNVNPDLRYFEYIVPCGIQDKAVASLERELGYKVDMQEIKNMTQKHFAEVFDVDFK